MIVPVPERAVQRMCQLMGRAMHRLSQPRGMFGYSHWLPAFETSLQHAAMIVLPAIAGVLITQMNFHPGDVLLRAQQRLFDRGADLSRQCLGAVNVGVSINLDLHGIFLMVPK